MCKLFMLALYTLVDTIAAATAMAPPPLGLTLFEFTSLSKPWVVTNDPVMGGVSNSSFSVANGVGVWSGEVKTVPYLKAPGTCQSYADIAAVDASEYDAVEITLVSKGPLGQFQLSWGGTYVPAPPHSPQCKHLDTLPWPWPGPFKAACL